MRKEFPNERMNNEMETASEVSFIETDFVSVRMTYSIIIIKNPNFNRGRELKPISNPPFVFPLLSIANTPSFMRGRRERDL